MNPFSRYLRRRPAAVRCPADHVADELSALRALCDRVARLNRDAGEIGAGMLAQLVDEARAIEPALPQADRRRRQEDADQFARAVGVLRADYSVPGAIRAAVVYGLNWTELLEAEGRVLALMAAADLVADPRLDGCDPDEYRTALAQLRTAVERCRSLKP